MEGSWCVGMGEQTGPWGGVEGPARVSKDRLAGNPFSSLGGEVAFLDLTPLCQHHLSAQGQWAHATETADPEAVRATTRRDDNTDCQRGRVWNHPEDKPLGILSF